MNRAKDEETNQGTRNNVYHGTADESVIFIRDANPPRERKPTRARAPIPSAGVMYLRAVASCSSGNLDAPIHYLSK